ncbi:hypothetical protein [Aliarcobacter vitoriensis]|uniref:Uncharacterized protein n=1 Tax=Aliarcobacter vitoriensis TaxID=2011099 RepID=A0A366MV09_9BACT|nr:hypothetical protein [Aliarcobacter vitoriensis]RBQ29897.1 hypothetical protein CRU91_01065 [Aliarcobacter vitoriensis]
MLIIGDSLVPYEKPCFISSLEDIKTTKPNSILLFNYDEKIAKYCYENSLNFAVIVDSLKEAIYANSLNSRYIISKIKLAKKIQKIAENYMFDSKNLAIIYSNDELEKVAKKEIDGVIYNKLLS